MFKPGDVVRLKSGGQTMTVKHIGTPRDPEAVYCEWFTGPKPEGYEFTTTSLELMTTAKP